MLGEPVARLRRSEVLAGLLWLLVVGTSLWQAYLYTRTPGPPTAVGASWPAPARLRPDPTRPTLVLCAHPRCPCTHTTLDELEELLARFPGRVAVRVLFSSDPEGGEAWTQTAQWRRVAALPDVEVTADPRGTAARTFGARVSGHVLLYSAEGTLCFEGGITRGRGHGGANPGRAALEALLEGREPQTRTAPVFGCLLGDEDES